MSTQNRTVKVKRVLIWCIVPALLVAWIARYRWVETFSWRWPGMWTLVWAGVIGVGMAPWVDLLWSVQARFYPPPVEYLRQTTELFVYPLAQHPILIPILVGVLAGVCEEILFRGVVFGWLRGRVPVPAAVVLSAMVFSLAHLGWREWSLLLPVLGIGCVLAILYHYSRSLWPVK